MTRPSPIGHLLVATDFSAGSDCALDRAGLLPLAPKARITILHVLPKTLDPARKAAIKKQAWHELERRSQRLATALAKRRVDATIKTAIARGKPDTSLAQWARLLKAQLVVVGRHGTRRFRDGLLGTTADRLVRHGVAPVLVVAHGAPASYRRPIVAVDTDPGSVAAAKVLLGLLPAGHRRPLAFHVVDLPFEGWMRTELSRREIGELRQRHLNEVAGVLGKAAPGIKWRLAAGHGDPRVAILAEARRRRADVIAVGTRGRTGLPRLLLGSVAEAVVQRGPCDVLVVRPSGRQ